MLPPELTRRRSWPRPRHLLGGHHLVAVFEGPGADGVYWYEQGPAQRREFVFDPCGCAGVGVPVDQAVELQAAQRFGEDLGDAMRAIELLGTEVAAVVRAEVARRESG